MQYCLPDHNNRCLEDLSTYTGSYTIKSKQTRNKKLEKVWESISATKVEKQGISGLWHTVCNKNQSIKSKGVQLNLRASFNAYTFLGANLRTTIYVAPKFRG